MVNNSVLLPKATAMWLIDNTALTFQQIADFCDLHIMIINSMANGEYPSIKPLNPIVNEQLVMEEITRCTENPQEKLRKKNFDDFSFIVNKKNNTKGSIRIKRKDKPGAILWLLRNYPQFGEKEIRQLIGTTKSVALSIINKTYDNFANLEEKNPIDLGLCSQDDINHFKISLEINSERHKYADMANDLIDQEN